MYISENLISDLVEQLKMGFTVYIYPQNLEIKSVMENDYNNSKLSLQIGNDSQTVHNFTGFVRILSPNNFEIYKVMIDFVDQISDIKLKRSLEKSVKGNCSNEEFEKTIGRTNFSGDWFNFKQKFYTNFLCNRLDLHNIPYQLF